MVKVKNMANETKLWVYPNPQNYFKYMRLITINANETKMPVSRNTNKKDAVVLQSNSTK